MVTTSPSHLQQSTKSTNTSIEQTASAAEDERESGGVIKQDGLPRRVWAGLRRVGGFLLNQWFVLGIGIVILLAHFFPNVGRSGGAIEAQYTIKYLLVAVIFFISGLSLPLAHLVKRAADWRLHLVCQVTSFLVFPAVVFGVVNAVRAADPNGERFDRWALVGLVVMGCLPTTVSSNVVMTGQAGGDQSAATIEVLIGNLVGTFLSPALLQMFLSSSTWAFGTPKASGPGGTGEIYRQVMEQLGYTVLIPLFVGEVVQWWQPVFVKEWRLKLKLAKLSSLCLLGVIWSTFCNAFYSGSFEQLNGGTITLVLLLNIAFYIFFSLLLFLVARIIPMPTPLVGPTNRPPPHREGVEPEAYWEARKLFDAPTTIGLLFCGSAKGIVLGSPIVQILYGGVEPIERGIITIPLVLFQGSQVVLGQLTVAILRSWSRRVAAKTERLRAGLMDEETEVSAGKIHNDSDVKGVGGSSGKDGSVGERLEGEKGRDPTADVAEAGPRLR